jgi:hypothetical protein
MKLKKESLVFFFLFLRARGVGLMYVLAVTWLGA